MPTRSSSAGEWRRCTSPSLFTTSRDDQQAIKIVVLQGQSIRASENDLLQDFGLMDLRAAPAGELEIEVAFEIDADGIFSASAKDLETGEEARVEVLGQSGFGEEELERIQEESQAYLDERRDEEATERLRQGVATLLVELERLFADAERWVAGNPTAEITLEHARFAHEQAKAIVDEGARSELAEQVVILEDAKSMVERTLVETDASLR